MSPEKQAAEGKVWRAESHAAMASIRRAAASAAKATAAEAEQLAEDVATEPADTESQA